MILARPSAGQRHQDCSYSLLCLLLVFYFTWGPLGPARAHYAGALQFVPCAVRALAATATLPSATSGRFSPLLTAELPRNHYNPPSGFDPVLRCYTPPGRTSLGGRSRSSGFTASCISLVFSAFSLSNPHVLPVEASRTIVQQLLSATALSFSFCATALTFSSWVARRSAPQTTTSSYHYIFIPWLIARCFSRV